MCLNLAKSDKVILAFDTNSFALDKARQGGIQCAESLDDLGKSDCDVIFTMLPGDAAVDAVLPALMKNWPRIIVDCSTVSPSTSRHWHTQVTMKGGDGSALFDAPVSGGVKGATDATLTFMVGAGHVEGPFETVRPLLEIMGQRVVHCGGPGAGSATKLCNNLALAAQMIGICEALNLGEALGVDPVVLSDVMNTSTAKSWSTEICNPHPEAAANIKVTSGGAISPPASRDYEGGFGTRLMLKDLGLAVSAGEAEGVALPLGAASKELYRLADLRGHGNKDFGVMLQFLRGK
jgi:3-hydroxyisobutyrate dehydrogenase